MRKAEVFLHARPGGILEELERGYSEEMKMRYRDLVERRWQRRQ